MTAAALVSVLPLGWSPFLAQVPILRPAHPIRSEVECSWHDSVSSRRALIAGNWKMSPATFPEAHELLKLVAANQRSLETSGRPTIPEVAVFPPMPFLAEAIALLRGTTVKVGAQNIAGRPGPGAFTGEVAASMVQSMGVEYALLGHSERRVLFHETDEEINAKVLVALRAGLRVILCVGETESEFDMGLLQSVCAMQLKKGLKDVTGERMETVTIAYEPVWAIGTGKSATPEQAQRAHGVLRSILTDMFGADVARAVRIQYGGSVNPENVDVLMRQLDVDGVLVGGASLSADKFARIVEVSPLPYVPAPQPHMLSARVAVLCKNGLGESPVWSERHQTLFWVSATDKELWAWNLHDAPWYRPLQSTVGCVVLDSGGGIVAATEHGLVGQTLEGTTSAIACAPEPTSLTRPNDGRVDRNGHLVLGMYNIHHRSGATAGEDIAGLYRFANGSFHQILDYKFRVSNGIAFSPEGTTMYFCDTPTRKVFAFDYSSDGPLSERRLVWTQPSAWPGGPDGAQVDAEGKLWIAISGASRVVRIDPTTGTVDMEVLVPVTNPTSCTFGGRDLATLFITTRRVDSKGGELYAVDMPFGIKGLPEPEMRM